jgi:hypothetical protein
MSDKHIELIWLVLLVINLMLAWLWVAVPYLRPPGMTTDGAYIIAAVYAIGFVIFLKL